MVDYRLFNKATAGRSDLDYRSKILPAESNMGQSRFVGFAMKIILIILITIAIYGVSEATNITCGPGPDGEPTVTVINYYTGRLDCITALPSDGSAGQCLTIKSNPPLVLQFSNCGSTSAVTNDLLLEDGTYFLFEDGTKLILEP